MIDNSDPNGCTAQLQALLSNAQSAAEQNDPDARRAVCTKLTDFIVASGPDNDCIRALDDIAGKAAAGLLQANIDDRLRDITTCNVELAKASKQFSAAAASAANTAQSLQLTRVANVLDALNAGVESIRQVQDDFTSGSDAALLDSLMKAEAAMVAARESLRLRNA